MDYPSAKVVDTTKEVESNEVEIEASRLVKVSGNSDFKADGKNVYLAVETGSEAPELNRHSIYLSQEYDWVIVKSFGTHVTLVPLKKEED